MKERDEGQAKKKDEREKEDKIYYPGGFNRATSYLEKEQKEEEKVEKLIKQRKVNREK